MASLKRKLDSYQDEEYDLQDSQIIDFSESENEELEDLQHDLRNDSQRVFELFPASRYPDKEELKIAKKIIESEKKARIEPPKDQTINRNPLSNVTNVTNVMKVTSAGTNPNLISTNSKPILNKANTNTTVSSGNSILSKLYSNDIKKGNIFSSSTTSNPTTQKPTYDNRLDYLSSTGYRKTDNFKVVGDNVVNMSQVMRNANLMNQTKNSTQTKSNTNQQSSSNNNKDALDVSTKSKIDQLLSKESLYSQDAENSWHEGFQQRMNKLAQREYAQQKASEVTSIVLKAFQCSTCHTISQTLSNICKEQNHNVKAIKAIKRFFECSNCLKRDSTLRNEADHKLVNLPPNHRCRCGSYNWVNCGMQGLGVLSVREKDRQSLHSERLVTSASDTTTRDDKLNMAVRVSNLNNKA